MLPRAASALARLGPLLALLVVALVPYGLVAEHVPLVGLLIDRALSSDGAHIVGHGVIFAVIGAALLACFPGLRARPWRYLGLILLIGVGQEGFQLLYKGRGPAANELLDLAVDLAAAAAVLALARRAGPAPGHSRRAGPVL